jgi:hypothetical protein
VLLQIPKFKTVVNKNVSSFCVTPCVVTNTEVSKEGLGCNIEVEELEAVGDKILRQSDTLVQYVCTE